MPAKSKKEAHLFGMAAAYKSGKKKLSDFPEKVRKEIKKLADSMSKEKLKHFTHVKEEKEREYNSILGEMGNQCLKTIADIITKAKAKNESSVATIDLTPEMAKEFAEEHGYTIEDGDDGWVDIMCPETGKVASYNTEGDVLLHDEQFANAVHAAFGIEEDAGAAPGPSAAPAPGAATLTNTTGRSSFDFGNNPQDGNSDTRKGSGEPTLTDDEDEEKLLKRFGIKEGKGEQFKLMSFSNFRRLKLRDGSIKESIVAGGLSEDNAKSLIQRVFEAITPEQYSELVAYVREQVQNDKFKESSYKQPHGDTVSFSKSYQDASRVSMDITDMNDGTVQLTLICKKIVKGQSLADPRAAYQTTSAHRFKTQSKKVSNEYSDSKKAMGALQKFIDHLKQQKMLY